MSVHHVIERVISCVSDLRPPIRDTLSTLRRNGRGEGPLYNLVYLFYSIVYLEFTSDSSSVKVTFVKRAIPTSTRLKYKNMDFKTWMTLSGKTRVTRENHYNDI